MSNSPLPGVEGCAELERMEPAGSFARIWAQAKAIERTVRATKQRVIEKVEGKREGESDEKLAQQVQAFDDLRKQQEALRKFVRKYANLQKEMHGVEQEIGTLMIDMGLSDKEAVFGKCMKMNGEVMANCARAREPNVANWDRFADSLETSFQKSLEDMQLSVDKYDKARRESQAQQAMLTKARAADSSKPDRVATIEKQLEEVQAKYAQYSFDLQQKLVLLAEHRSRELSIRTSTCMEVHRTQLVDASKAFAHWIPFEFHESEAQAAVEAVSNATRPGGYAGASYPPTPSYDEGGARGFEPRGGGASMYEPQSQAGAGGSIYQSQPPHAAPAQSSYAPPVATSIYAPPPQQSIYSSPGGAQGGTQGQPSAPPDTMFGLPIVQDDD
eukprot:CAMPEP_0114557000 /NCGR_PEP_ID=MMETSP0114-20121206/9590_1 /TAXON_ID=31324 /ORGANISM="Goniomonas sp, Strain m" /LENGTH=385 /DNA_ID=CAMNT_0001742245 /DNA_START=83 /DNA_END=1240 /DNA_ORIENTATION=-